MLNNPVLNEAIWNFKSAYKKTKAPIWLKLQKMMERTGSKRGVNLSKLSRFTEEGDMVIVPGKILGAGTMDHKITICAFSLSQSAAKKIIESGSEIFSIKTFVEKFPKGSKVKIVG
ncbi:MAG: 50S ribosomal protein L18e [Thaumarchaeota archaeon]|nr:50S ribosomal protein L18e [Nitrososphaerota archaeon]